MRKLLLGFVRKLILLVCTKCLIDKVFLKPVNHNYSVYNFKKYKSLLSPHSTPALNKSLDDNGIIFFI